MAGFGVSDVGYGSAEGTGHGVEGVEVAGEVLVRPGIGVSVAGNADAVEVTGLEGGIDYPVGVFAVRGCIQPVHAAVGAPGGFGHRVTGDKVEYGVDADESGLWFEYVHGLADVVAIGGGFVFVDFEDDVVVVCVLRGGSKDLRVLRWKSRPGGDEPGYVVVEFNVHRMGSGFSYWRYWVSGHSEVHDPDLIRLNRVMSPSAVYSLQFTVNG